MVSQDFKHWFTELTSRSPFFFAVLDNRHDYVMVNDRYSQIAKLSPKDLVGKNDTQVFGQAYYEQLRHYYLQAFNGELVETTVVIRNTTIETTLYLSLTPVMSDNNVVQVVFQALDITETQTHLHHIQESETKFSKLLNILHEGVLFVENNEIISCNKIAASILGCQSPSDLYGELVPDVFINTSTQMPLNINESNTYSNYQPVLCTTRWGSGSERLISLRLEDTTLFGNTAYFVLLTPQGTPGKSTAIDVHIDQLTGLYNRSGFTKELDQMIAGKTSLVMLYLDIDNFKNINDSLGHHIGDKVIREVAFRLKRLLPPDAILGHLGADEFGLIIPEPDKSRTAEMLSERIISLINQPFDLNYFSKRLACSIGTVNYPGDGEDSRILLQNADTAMYEAKARGRNRMIRFSSQMNKEARTRLWLEIELQKALQQSTLEVWYQPKVNAKNYNINGAEALVRWKHPVEGYISPGAFIPVAEKAGLIEHLGRVVMRDVFSTVKRWKQKGILPGPVAINLSPEQFGNPQLITFMEKLLRSTQIDPGYITFELTESAVMSDSEYTIEMLNAIKKLGFTLSIDDFGTGYSSLSYLARFPIDELKIDRAFITDIDLLPKQITVIENIINLGKSLKLNVVAEGVETQQQAILLSNLHCHSIQGFHFYRPLPRQEVEKLFIQNKAYHPE